jgi:hypothetical protein
MKKQSLILSLMITLVLSSVSYLAYAQERPSQQPQAQQPAQGQASPTSAQSQVFTGQIVKMSDKYVLQETSTGATHQLDDQDKAKPFEGKTVKVSGSLDASNVIHVDAIEGAK